MCSRSGLPPGNEESHLSSSRRLPRPPAGRPIADAGRALGGPSSGQIRPQESGMVTVILESGTLASIMALPEPGSGVRSFLDGWSLARKQEIRRAVIGLRERGCPQPLSVPGSGPGNCSMSGKMGQRRGLCCRTTRSLSPAPGPRSRPQHSNAVHPHQRSQSSYWLDTSAGAGRYRGIPAPVSAQAA